MKMYFIIQNTFLFGMSLYLFIKGLTQDDIFAFVFALFILNWALYLSILHPVKKQK